MKYVPLFTLLGVLVHGVACADSYAGAVAGVSFIRIDSASFDVINAGLAFGHRANNGFGVEFDMRTGVAGDDDDDVKMEMDWQASSYLTYSGVFNRRALLTLGGGYATTRLDSSVQGSAFPGKQDFNGPAFLLRLEEQMINYPNIVLSLSYQHFYLDGDVSIQNASFGVTYDF